MFGLGAGEVILILLFALIFIGPKKLPELAKGLGKGIREFQKAKDELMTEMKASTVDQLTESETKTSTEEKSTDLHEGELPETPETAESDESLIKPKEDEEDDIARANRELDEENDPEGHGDYDPEPMIAANKEKEEDS
jgi:sec-independent protein translocase protein TatA